MPIGPYSPDTTPNQGGSLPSPVIPPAEGDQTVTPAVTGGPQPAATPGLKDRVLGTLNAFRSPQDPEASPTGMLTPIIGETPAAPEPPEPIVTTLTPAPEPVPTAIPASPPQITTPPDTFSRATDQSTPRFGETIEPPTTPLTPDLAAAEPGSALPSSEPSSTPPDTTPTVPETLQTLAEPAQTTEAPDTVGQTASEPSPEPTTDPEDKKGPLSPEELKEYRKLNERLLDQLQSDGTIADANKGDPKQRL